MSKRYFPLHGYYRQPFYFESSEGLFPGLTLACIYDKDGLLTWGLFDPSGDEVPLAELGPYEAKFAMESAERQAQKHLAKYADQIQEFVDSLPRVQEDAE